MKVFKKVLALALATVMSAAILTGCGQDSDSRTIIRIGHNVEVFPSELLGSQNEMVQLTQTGAINFCVASNSLLETFSTNYTLFNLPYLFASAEAYHASMDDEAITGPIFESTKDAGFEAVTWLDAGTRNFYTVSTPIETPADLKGLKIRVQQSPTNV